MQVEQINKPHEIYCGWDMLDPQALEQFRNALENPWVTRGALMPDTHKGYSLPIGGVVETDGIIVPAWVGYDIGCGMCAIPTTFKSQDIYYNAHAIHEAIHAAVPVGNNKHPEGKPLCHLSAIPRTQIAHHALQVRDGLKQLGTLGGGNHFIEVGVDEEDTVWIIIHSGSRGTGHQIAGSYMKTAAEHHGVFKGNNEGHYGLDIMGNLGSMYMTDLNWALEYALENRKRMMEATIYAIRSILEYGGGVWNELINRNHNHAEVKDGKVIHRKGATHAEAGMMGVIPGNMMAGSYIVKGKGNPGSLCSSSHGAGRVLSRSQAKKTLDVEEFLEDMDDIVSDASQSTIDESPKAYKSIEKVMEQQVDLVEVVHRVRPLINIKG